VSLALVGGKEDSDGPDSGVVVQDDPVDAAVLGGVPAAGKGKLEPGRIGAAEHDGDTFIESGPLDGGERHVGEVVLGAHGGRVAGQLRPLTRPQSTRVRCPLHNNRSRIMSRLVNPPFSQVSQFASSGKVATETGRTERELDAIRERIIKLRMGVGEQMSKVHNHADQLFGRNAPAQPDRPEAGRPDPDGLIDAINMEIENLGSAVVALEAAVNRLH
jgi:hypothetical protein